MTFGTRTKMPETTYGNVTIEELRDAWRSRCQMIAVVLEHPTTLNVRAKAQAMKRWNTVVNHIPGDGGKLHWIRRPDGRLDCIVRGVIYLEFDPS